MRNAELQTGKKTSIESLSQRSITPNETLGEI